MRAPDRWTPAGPAIAHATALTRLGWSYEAIDQAAGLPRSTTWALLRDRPGMVLGSKARAIRAVPVVRRISSYVLADSPVGTRRRVQALAWMGWPSAEVSQRCGMSAKTLAVAMGRGVSTLVEDRVRRVYDELSCVSGPSGGARRAAKRFGWAPPLAWDEDTIDDPAARPQGVREVAA